MSGKAGPAKQLGEGGVGDSTPPYLQLFLKRQSQSWSVRSQVAWSQHSPRSPLSWTPGVGGAGGGGGAGGAGGAGVRPHGGGHVPSRTTGDPRFKNILVKTSTTKRFKIGRNMMNRAAGHEEGAEGGGGAEGGPAGLGPGGQG